MNEDPRTIQVRFMFGPISPHLRTTYRLLRKKFERRDANLICAGIAMGVTAAGDRTSVVRLVSLAPDPPKETT